MDFNACRGHGRTFPPLPVQDFEGRRWKAGIKINETSGQIKINMKFRLLTANRIYVLLNKTSFHLLGVSLLLLACCKVARRC